MKKIISISLLSFLVLCCAIPLFVSKNGTKDEKKDKVTYQQGYVQGENIYAQFECVGETASKTVFGGNGIKNIYCRQTTDGGWVAWTGKRYIYTTTDVGAETILSKAGIEFMEPLDGLGY